MKKSMVFFVMLFCLSPLAFAQQEVWISAGYEFGDFVDGYIYQGQEIETVTSSHGMNIASYNFLFNRFGIFARGSFLSPKKTWVWDDNGMTTIDLSDYSLTFDSGLIFGMVYRLDFTNDFKSYFGLGINWFTTMALFSGAGTASYSRDTNNIGIGGDIGVKVDISDRFFLQIGSILTLDFARHELIETFTGTSLTHTSSRWHEKYLLFSARPYFAAGLNFFWNIENGRRRFISGKPS